MGWESFDVVTSDLGPLLQGQTTAKLKNAYNFRNPHPLCLCYVRGTPPARNKVSGISLVFYLFCSSTEFLKIKKHVFTSPYANMRKIYVCIYSDGFSCIFIHSLAIYM